MKETLDDVVFFFHIQSTLYFDDFLSIYNSHQLQFIFIAGIKEICNVMSNRKAVAHTSGNKYNVMISDLVQ